MVTEPANCTERAPVVIRSLEFRAVINTKKDHKPHNLNPKP